MSRLSLPLVPTIAKDGLGFRKAKFFSDLDTDLTFSPLHCFACFGFNCFGWDFPFLPFFLEVTLSCCLWDFVCCVLNKRNMFSCYVRISHFSLQLWLLLISQIFYSAFRSAFFCHNWSTVHAIIGLINNMHYTRLWQQLGILIIQKQDHVFNTGIDT